MDTCSECGRKTYDIRRLDVVFVLLNLLLELVQRNLVVLDYQVDLQLLDAEPDCHQLRATPDQAVFLNAAHDSLELLHVRLVVWNLLSAFRASRVITRARTPWLDIHCDNGLGRRLGLALLLFLVLRQTLVTHTRSLGILLLVVAAE